MPNKKDIINKKKEKAPTFNIVKTLAHKDNRDIFRILFKNLDGKDRLHFYMSGLPKEKRKISQICNKCLDYPCETKMLSCSYYYGNPNNKVRRHMLLCLDCFFDHVNNNTKIASIVYDKREVTLEFIHTCKYCGINSHIYHTKDKSKVDHIKENGYKSTPSFICNHPEG